MSTQHPALREVAGFRVLRELGRGGAGAVYLAVQEALDREVALKILHRDMAEDDVYLQRFFREAKAAAIFAHPNVVAVHDAGEDKATGDYYIAFEYVDGGSLDDLLQAGKLDEGRALEITRMIAQALFFAESKRLIHRDVKPANILIAKDGTAKLADLGLAKKTDPDAPKVTVEGLIVGTPYYMAPEQALGRVDIDNRVDIYALGLVLYCMLTGRTPYLETREENSTVIHVLSRRLTEELPNVKVLEPDVSDATAQLIRDMTARKREQRYRSATDIVRDIDRILDGSAPLGPEGVEPRLSDLPTTSVDAASLHAAMTQANPGLAETLAAARAEVSPLDAPTTASSDSGALPAATADDDATTESGVRRAARKLASSSSAELETIRQRPLYLIALLVVLSMGIGLGALGRSARPDPNDTAGHDPLVELPPSHGSPTAQPNTSPDAEATSPVEPAADSSPADTSPTDTPPIDDPFAETSPSPQPSPAPNPTRRPSPSPAVSPSPEDGSEDHTGPVQLPPLDPIGELDEAVARELSAALFQNVPHGSRMLEAVRAGDRYGETRAGTYLVEVLTAARALLNHNGAPWSRREQLLNTLDAALRTYELDPRPLSGSLGRAVATELEAWGGFARGVRTLRQAIADPRLRAKALDHLRQIPPRLGVAESADLLLGLTDRVDRHQRWLRLDRVRADLGPHLRDVRAKLATNAVGYTLREEVQAICAVLGQLVDDSESCLIAALSHASVVDLPPSAFVDARTQVVPHRASLRSMSGWGVRIDVAAPPGLGDQLRIEVDDHIIELSRDLAKLDDATRTIGWRGSTRIYVALRTHQLLVRIEDGDPSNLTLALPFERGGNAPRFTVRAQGGLELTGVVIAQIPSHPGR